MYAPSQHTKIGLRKKFPLMQEVEKFVLPQERKSKNSDGKTPLTIFNQKHRELVSYETQWIISMATSCTVAASLIATVAFAAAITNDRENFHKILTYGVATNIRV
ncbi:Ankyrin repeat family protein [Forsythia ovata]|uniref:Ankyrin repeat family protein n=1 Tax=Forsythia ovata TaxID=205694 RepID=A0ABD1X0G4_9LAMI